MKTNSKAKWHAHRFGRLYWTGPILEKNHEGAVVVTILLCHPSQYEKRGTHTGKYFVVVPTRKIRNVNKGSTSLFSLGGTTTKYFPVCVPLFSYCDG